MITKFLQIQRRRTVRLRTAAFSLLLGGSATFAGAQTTSPDTAADVILLEAVSVTGSNIKRTDQEKVLPVTVVGLPEIEARDSATPMDLLTAIPQITNIPANETSTNAVAARGDNANVALRGFGASNTLVVLNGRRLPFHPFNTSSVNVNTLPTFGLQQVEILRDGASAIYGSDAVAGVVNYVTRKEPDGGEYSIRYGVTEHGGGMDIQGNLGYGTTFAGGRGTWLFNLTAYNRDAIYLRERAASHNADKTSRARPPFNVPGSAYDDLSANTRWTQFRLGANVATGAVRSFHPADGNPDSTPSLNTTALPRSLYDNYNQYIAGQPLSARLNVFNRFEYQLNDQIRAFGELSGYLSKSRTNRQPMALNSSDAVVTLAVDNPYNPFGSRFYSATGATNADGTARLTGTPQAITIAATLLPDGGVEKITATNNVYRVLAGLQGRIGSSTWNWETAVMYGAVRATDSLENSVRESKLQAAGLRTDATAWNPFGYTFKVANGAVVADQPYANPAAVRAGYTQALNRYGHSSIASVDARIGGEIVDLWAGPIAASFGAEWRREYKEDTKDPFAGSNPIDSGLDPQNNDFITTSPKFNYDAYRTITSLYAETVIPLAAPQNNLPGLYALELNASARYEDYLDFGDTTKPKFGLNWKPAQAIMLRASQNEGFSAPDLAVLYQPPSFQNAAPPGTRDTVRNNYLLSAGLPADVQVLAKTYSIGNSTLQPEESKGRSVGIAVDVPWIKGLSFTVDYWELEQTNLIITNPRDASLDAQLLLRHTQEQLAKGIPIEQINVGSRVTPDDTAGNYVGDPNTLRAAATAEDRALFAQSWAALPQSQWTAALGQWIGGISRSVNGTGRNVASGIDYSLSYSLPNTPLGQFRISTEWAKFLESYSQNTPTSPINDSIKALNTAEWKGTTTLQWRKGPWNASLSATYSTPTRTGATTTLATYEALGRPDYIKVITNNGSTSYVEEGHDQFQLNAGLGYRFGADAHAWVRNTSFRLGVNNLLDEEPNLTADSTGYSGSTGSSLWVGRAYTLQVSRRF